MKFKQIIFFIALPLLGLSTGVFADQVELKNGDKISGVIKDDNGSTISIQTQYMGVVSIAKSEVASSKTDAQMQEEKAAEEIKKKDWKGELAAGYDIRTGNTQDSKGSAEINFRKECQLNAYQIQGRTQYGSQNKKMNALKHYGMGRIERKVSDLSPWFYFGQIEADTDRFANIDWRLLPSAGFGYWFSNTDDWKLMTELGLGYTHTEHRDLTKATDEVTLVPRLFLEKKLFDRIVVSEDFRLYPSLSDTSEYRFTSETKVDSPINDRVSLRFSLLDQYNSLPGGSKKKNDLTFTSGLAYKF